MKPFEVKYAVSVWYTKESFTPDMRQWHYSKNDALKAYNAAKTLGFQAAGIYMCRAGQDVVTLCYYNRSMKGRVSAYELDVMRGEWRLRRGDVSWSQRAVDEFIQEDKAE